MLDISAAQSRRILLKAVPKQKCRKSLDDMKTYTRAANRKIAREGK
jgi:hypothetical protein